MATDIKLDDGDGNQVVVECNILRSTAYDFILDAPGRRRSGGPRRALVHDGNDGLTVNFNGDYPGGVTVGGNLRVSGNLAVTGRVEWSGGGAASDSDIDWLRDRIDQLETTVNRLLTLVGHVVIPRWTTIRQVEDGDMIDMPSAHGLGLVVHWYPVWECGEDVMQNQVIKLDPSAGTMVPVGTIVDVTFCDRP